MKLELCPGWWWGGGCDSDFSDSFSKLINFLCDSGPGVTDGIASYVLHDIEISGMFPSLQDHLLDSPIDDNHISKLRGK